MRIRIRIQETKFNADPCGSGSGYGSGSETLMVESMGSHSIQDCKVCGDIAPEERERVIKNINMCLCSIGLINNVFLREGNRDKACMKGA